VNQESESEPEAKRRKAWSEPPLDRDPQQDQQDQQRPIVQFEDISAEVVRRLVEQKRRGGWVDPMARDGGGRKRRVGDGEDEEEGVRVGRKVRRVRGGFGEEGV